MTTPGPRPEATETAAHWIGLRPVPDAIQGCGGARRRFHWHPAGTAALLTLTTVRRRRENRLPLCAPGYLTWAVRAVAWSGTNDYLRAG